jgi:hypothetical protein
MTTYTRRDLTCALAVFLEIVRQECERTGLTIGNLAAWLNYQEMKQECGVSRAAVALQMSPEQVVEDYLKVAQSNAAIGVAYIEDAQEMGELYDLDYKKPVKRPKEKDDARANK